MRTNKFIVPAVTGLVIVLTLVVTIIIKSGTPFELTLILVYVGVGAIVFDYSALLKKFKMNIASNLLLIFTVLSGIIFYFPLDTRLFLAKYGMAIPVGIQTPICYK